MKSAEFYNSSFVSIGILVLIMFTSFLIYNEFFSKTEKQVDE